LQEDNSSADTAFRNKNMKQRDGTKPHGKYKVHNTTVESYMYCHIIKWIKGV